MDEISNNLYWHNPSITIHDRWESNRHKSCILWFTGLSASGKSTLANALSRKLHDLGIKCYVLDGDNIRHGLNKDLGFSPEHRKENIRRIAEVAKLFVDAGLIVMTAFISPYKEDRESARKLAREDEFIEISVQCCLEECERRDPKGIYKKARSGEIKEFTGISAPYETPENAEIIIETDKFTLDECLNKIIGYLSANGYIKQ